MDEVSRNQFLDTGWYSEAEIYYKGYIYWFEGGITDRITKKIRFFINKFKVSLYEEDGETYYSIFLDEDNRVIEGSIIYEVFDVNFDDLKLMWMKEPIFEGKKFWEVEHELEWIEEGDPIIVNSK